MQRREFLAASAAAAIGLAAPEATRAALEVAGDNAERQLIELRVYHFASPEKRDAFEEILSSAAIPAFNRAGVEPAGAFKLLAKDNPDLKLAADANDLYVVLPHKTVESFLGLGARMAGDFEFLQAAQAMLLAPKSDPTYVRYEVSLLRAFATFPQVQAPTKAAGRVAQLRTYESHSSERAMMKIRMFEEGGEIAIFKRVGLNPVFFGQTMAGTKMPNVTYMLAFEDEKALKSAWDKFRADADWKTLQGDETYKDAVSNITNLVLRPVGGSQI